MNSLPVRTILGIVSGIFEVPETAILSCSRTSEAVQARQAAMWFAANYTSKSISEIGRLLGGHNHRTVSAAIIRAEFQREKDPVFAARLQQAAEIIERTAVTFRESGVTCRPDPDPLAIAQRVLASKHNETLISLEEIRVLATAVVVTFGNDEEGRDHG